MATKKPAKKAGEGEAPPEIGRPSTFTQAVGDDICERLADGESLRAICADSSMPHRATVFRWIGAHESFRDQYARAREEQAEALADEIVAISDEECTMVRADKHPGAKADNEDGEVEVVFDSTAVARNRLRVDARKWVASKLKPKKYGDKILHTGDPDSPIEHRLGLSDAALEAVAARGLPSDG